MEGVRNWPAEAASLSSSSLTKRPQTSQSATHHACSRGGRQHDSATQCLAASATQQKHYQVEGKLRQHVRVRNYAPDGRADAEARASRAANS